jgi:hypothetical protein
MAKIGEIEPHIRDALKSRYEPVDGRRREKAPVDTPEFECTNKIEGTKTEIHHVE